MDVLKSVIPELGFQILDWQVRDTTYCHNPNSMAEIEVKCCFFVCQAA
jgi:hypothetical protein